jgi:hypothetical protein
VPGGKLVVPYAPTQQSARNERGCLRQEKGVIQDQAAVWFSRSANCLRNFATFGATTAWQ